MSVKSPHPGMVYYTLLRFARPNWQTTGSLQIGKVTAISTGTAHWVRVALTGVQSKPTYTPKYTTIKLRYLSTYTPTVGDVVVIHRGQGRQRGTRYVVGKLA